MSLKYESGLIGKYRDREVYTLTQEYYEEHRDSYKDDFVVLITGNDNGIYDFILNGKIVGTINDNRQVNLARDSVSYDKKYGKKKPNTEVTYYTYNMKDDRPVVPEAPQSEINLTSLLEVADKMLAEILKEGEKLVAG